MLFLKSRSKEENDITILVRVQNECDKGKVEKTILSFVRTMSRICNARMSFLATVDDKNNTLENLIKTQQEGTVCEVIRITREKYLVKKNSVKVLGVEEIETKLINTDHHQSQ